MCVNEKILIERSNPSCD